MELIGKLIRVLPEQTGQSAKGPWVRGGFVIETEEQFPRTVAFSLWGEDKVGVVRNMPMGTQIKVYFSPESREYQERWYTDLRCFRIDTFNTAMSSGQPQAGMNQYQPQEQFPPQQQYAQQTQFQQPAQQAPVQESQPIETGSFDSSSTAEDDDLPF